MVNKTQFSNDDDIHNAINDILESDMPQSSHLSDPSSPDTNVHTKILTYQNKKEPSSTIKKPIREKISQKITDKLSREKSPTTRISKALNDMIAHNKKNLPTTDILFERIQLSHNSMLNEMQKTITDLENKMQTHKKTIENEIEQIQHSISSTCKNLNATIEHYHKHASEIHHAYETNFTTECKRAEKYKDFLQVLLEDK